MQVLAILTLPLFFVLLPSDTRYRVLNLNATSLEYHEQMANGKRSTLCNILQPIYSLKILSVLIELARTVYFM
jgi:hypothetical protein